MEFVRQHALQIGVTSHSPSLSSPSLFLPAHSFDVTWYKIKTSMCFARGVSSLFAGPACPEVAGVSFKVINS